MQYHITYHFTWETFIGIDACVGILGTIIFLFRKCIKYINYLNINKDLHPFYSYDDIKSHARYYVPTQIQRTAPSNYDEPSWTDANAIKTPAIPFLIGKLKDKRKSNRFFVILADSGMGKTTLLLNLYLQYISKINRQFKIKLVPLGDPQSDNAISEMPEYEKKRTILLLDAFDEDTRAYKDYKSRLDEIIKLSSNYRKIIISCRTQFFPTEIQEPSETGVVIHAGEKGFMKFEKFYISPFDDLEIKKYLIKRFGRIFGYFDRKKAFSIVKKSPDLMVRPMLLSYIDDLVYSNEQYKYSHEIYAQLVSKWIERESRFKKNNEEQINYKFQLEKFSKEVSEYMYINRLKNGSLKIELNEITRFVEDHQIQLDKLSATSRSLLNRNSQGDYKFSHKSVAEYFIALKLVSDEFFKKNFSYEGMDVAKKFCDEITYKNFGYTFLIKSFESGLKVGNDDVDIVCKKTRLDVQNYKSFTERDLFDTNEIVLRSLAIKQIHYFECFSKLTVLDLAHNDIRIIDGFCMLKLNVLILEHNNIKSIDNLFMPNLNYLDLNSNKIIDWDFIFLLRQLKYLNLRNCDVDASIINRIQERLPNCRIETDDINQEEVTDNFKKYLGYIIKHPTSTEYPRYGI